MAHTQPQTPKRQAREAINHAKNMGRQLADHQRGTGSLWLHRSNQLGLLNYDINSIRAAAATYVRNTHADHPRPGTAPRELWDNLVDAYLDQFYVVLAQKMGTKENMEEIVDAVGSTIYGRSIKGVSVEGLPEYFMAYVLVMQRDIWEERARDLKEEWEQAVRFGDHNDPEILRHFVNWNAELAWTEPIAV